MGYNEVFGGTNVYPADVTYLALALTADVDLDWPMESAAPPYPMARIIDVMATAGNHTMRLPDATMSAPGAIVLFNNLSMSNPCVVINHAGAVVANLGVGEQWELYLTDNTTPGGAWQVFRFGASTATVQPSALAGYGLTVTGSTLSQSVPVTTFNASPRNVVAADRASALVWTGAGTAILNLPGVAAVGNNYFFSARNAGGGMLTLDPLGGEVVDGAATVSLTPGEGVVLVTDGVQWFTLGRGQSAVFAFDYIVIDLTGQPSPYVLAGVQLNRISYKFTGALTTNMIVQVPTTVQQYWIDNRTTGAFSLSLRAGPAGTPIAVVQGSRGIYYCDGSQIIDADTSSISVPISAADGGTGQSVYTIGDLLTASGPTTLARLPAAPVGQVLISTGALTAPVWSPNPVVGTLTVSGVVTAGDAILAKSVANNALLQILSFNSGIRVAALDANQSVAKPLILMGDTIAMRPATATNDIAIFGPGGVQVMSLKAGAGQNQVYMGFYARDATPLVRSGYMGYVGAGAVDLTIGNEIGGIKLVPSNTFIGLNSAAALGTRGVVQISAANDPAITPAALDIQQGGVAGTTAVPQYGIRFDQSYAGGGSSNQATIMYGVWSYAKQNVGGAAIGVYGEVPANSGTTGHGVHGKADCFANVVYGFNVLNGVYGEVTSSNLISDLSRTAAGCFQHKGTRGDVAVGVLASTVTGPTFAQPLRCEHDGVPFVYVTAKGAVPGVLTVSYNTVDPAVTPALLHVAQNGSGANGAVVPAYGIKVDATSWNTGFPYYGVYSKAIQAVGWATYGVYGETGATNSNTISHGVHGKAIYNSDLSNSSSGNQAGVYGEITQFAGTTNTNVTCAAAFEHKGTKGLYNIAVWATTVAGGTNINGFRHDHAGVNVFVTQPTGIACIMPATAAAANVNSAADGSILARSSSSLRYKREVEAIDPIDAHRLLAVQAVQFKSRCEVDNPNTTYFGFIAEDMAEAGLTPLLHYAFQEDQLERVRDDAMPGTEEEPQFKIVPKKGEQKRPDGIQYERVVVLQQQLINELYDRLSALEAKLQ